MSVKGEVFLLRTSFRFEKTNFVMEIVTQLKVSKSRFRLEDKTR